MPVKIFSLSGVPDDEADDVRALLNDGDLEYFETPAGNWGISAPAIWLRDEGQFGQARALIDAYQRERMFRVRAEYEQRQKEGRSRTVIDVILENPLRFLAYLAAIAAIVYFSVKPFLYIGK